MFVEAARLLLLPGVLARLIWCASPVARCLVAGAARHGWHARLTTATVVACSDEAHCRVESRGENGGLGWTHMTLHWSDGSGGSLHGFVSVCVALVRALDAGRALLVRRWRFAADGARAG